METEFIKNIIHNIKMELLSISYTDKSAFLKELEKDILETNNLELIYTICREIADVDIDVYTKAIVDSKDPKYNYLLAKDLRKMKFGISDESFLLQKKYLGLCEKIVLDSKDLEYNYRFSKKYNINVLEHGQVIIDSKDLEYNYLFAENVNGADVQAHGRVIIESKNLEYNYKFAKDVKNADVDAHRLVILEAEKRSFVDENEKNIIDKFLAEFPVNDYFDEVTSVKNLIKMYNKN